MGILEPRPCTERTTVAAAKYDPSRIGGKHLHARLRGERHPKVCEVGKCLQRGEVPEVRRGRVVEGSRVSVKPVLHGNNECIVLLRVLREDEVAAGDRRWRKRTLPA